VRVIQRGEDARFALEACKAIGVRCEGGRQDFDRHLATELRVSGAIDLAHSARAERREDLIRTEATACQRHVGSGRILDDSAGTATVSGIFAQ